MTEQLRIFAGLQGFVSAAGLLALVLFFALATPFSGENRRWFWLGPVNDWLYVLGAAPWIVASVLLVVRSRGGALLWVTTIVLSVLIVAGAVVTLLMLAGRAGLNAQFAVAGPMTLVGFIWLWPAAAAATRAAALPPWMLALSVALVIGFFVGGAVFASGFLLPADSGLRGVIFVVGAVPLGLAMVGFPVWWLIVASTAR